MKKENKLIKTIKASILCIRFPFLYPRNRWDGKHHAYKLNNILYKLNREAITEVGITATRHEPIKELITHAENYNVTVDGNSHILTLSTCTSNGKRRMVLHAKLVNEEKVF